MRADEFSRPNWLLIGSLIVSLAVHAMVVVHMAGFYDVREMSYIELEMYAGEKPAARSIPVPPRRHKAKSIPDIQAAKPVPTVPVERPTVPSVTPLASAVRPLPVEPLVSPKRPQASGSRLIAWSPAEPSPAVENKAGSAFSSYSSKSAYYNLVRMMIESHKRYPYVARRRHHEGRVVVSFVIETDGRASNVRLVHKSPYRSLNKAALESVKAASPFPKPPAQLFNGPVELEITIIFTLT